MFEKKWRRAAKPKKWATRRNRRRRHTRDAPQVPCAPEAQAFRRSEGRSFWQSKTALIIIYSFLGMGFLRVDLFGFDSATTRYSQNVFYNVMSSQYGKRLQSPPAPGTELLDGPHVLQAAVQELKPAFNWNERMTVILLDDEALGANDRSGVVEKGGIRWPPPMKYHVRLLTKLYDLYRPSAIMVDLLVLDKRPADKGALEEFVALAARIREDRLRRGGKTRLYLAAGSTDPLCTDILRELSTVADLATVSWPEPNAAAPNPLYYPVATGAGDLGKCKRGEHPGAAFTMFKNLCRDLAPDEFAAKARLMMNCDALDRPDKNGKSAFETPMQVVWGSIAPELNWNQTGLHVSCIDQPRFWPTRLIDYLRATAFGNVSEILQRCPYAKVIKARDFMNAAYHSPRAKYNAVSIFHDAFAAQAGDLPKIVFYGSSFKAAGDLVATPTHVAVPGVFLHAMALDNLLTYGDRYITDPEELPEVPLLLKAVMVILVSTVAVIGRGRYQEAKRRYAPGSTAFFTTCFIVGVTLLAGMLIIGVTMYLSFTWGRLSPANWLGYLSVMTPIMALRDDWLKDFAENTKTRAATVFSRK